MAVMAIISTAGFNDEEDNARREVMSIVMRTIMQALTQTYLMCLSTLPCDV